MSRNTTVLILAVLTASSIGTESLAQRLGGACRGIARRGYVGLPKFSRLRAWSANRPTGWYRRGVPVFSTTVSGYYYGGRTTWNKALRGDYYCRRYRFNTIGIPVGIYGDIRSLALPVAPAVRVRRAPGVFTSTPTFSSRITYGDKYGWNKFADGKPAEAKNVFLQQARRQPNYGMPKVGYAIATAAEGHLADGARLLRYAVKKHPRTLKRMSLDAKARTALKSLAAKYREKKDAGDADAAYLLATLDKLQPKPPAARQTVDAGGLRIIPR